MEHAVPLWHKSVPPEKIAASAASFTMRWTEVGHLVPTVSVPAAMHAQLELPIEAKHVLDLMVAWQEVNHTFHVQLCFGRVL